MNINIKSTIVKIAITIIVIYFGDKFYNDYYNSLEKVYTVGELGKTYKPYGQGTKVRFSFIYYGKLNQSHNALGYNKIDKHLQKYLIEVPIKDIKRSRILWDYPVPDTLKAPFEGWEEIPEFLEKRKSDNR